MSKTTVTIGKDDRGHAVKLDVARLIVSRLLVTAASGGGKSWLLRKILEEVSGTTQTLVIDPEGEFASLRQIRDMVLVGPDGDLPADPRSSGLLVRRLMEQNVSAVIDISELTPPRRREFVAGFCGELVDLPKSLWRPCFVAIDEVHEFAPNTKDKDYVSANAIDLLFSKGRKRGYCPIVATQRISNLSSNVAAEAKNRFIGQTGYDVDLKRAADFLGFGKDRWPEIRDLSPPGSEGEFFAVGPAFTARGVIKFRAGDVKSHHPRAGEAGKAEPPQPSKKIAAVLGELQDLATQAEEEARTVEQLKAKNADLERQLKARPTVNDDKAVAIAVAAAERRVRTEMQQAIRLAGRNAGVIKRQLETIMKLVAKIEATGFEGTSVPPEQIEAAVRAAVTKVVEMYERKLSATQKYVEQVKQDVSSISTQLAKLAAEGLDVKVDVKHNPPFSVSSPVPSSRRAQDREVAEASAAARASGFSKPEERIIASLTWWRSIGVERPLNAAVALVAKYSPSSTSYTNPRGSLKAAGVVEYPEADRVSLTTHGLDIAGQFRLGAAVDDTLAALHETVMSVLNEPSRRLLKPLLEQYPSGLSNEQLAAAANYSATSTSYTNPRGQLRSLGLIEYRDGKVVAADLLFPEGLR